MASLELLQALAVTAELTSTELTPAAAKLLAEDLSGFPEQQVLGALIAIRYDGARLTLANVVARIDDGRPGAEEAWAMLPHHEADSAAITDEMASAYGVALPLLNRGDDVGARMAFKEAYTKAVAKARREKVPTHWFLSLGSDPARRESAVIEAARLQRIPVDHAITFLPPENIPQALKAIGVTSHPLLAAPDQQQLSTIKGLIAKGANYAKAA